MRSGKVDCLIQVVGEINHAAGQGEEMLKICDMVMDERKTLRDWELSTLILI